jgi:hypothetical protein
LAANPHSCSIDGEAPKRVAVASTLFAALELWDGDGDAGPVERRLFVCTYTMRGETRRLISVRKASRQEQNTWLR